MIEQGAKVKVFFRNSTQAEGIVEEWDNNEAVLISADGFNRFIIFDIKLDVLGVKIYYEEQEQEEQQNQQQVEVEKGMQEVQNQFEEVRNLPSQDDLRLKKLVDLKRLMIDQEKTIVANKLKEHVITEVRLPQYGIPNFAMRRNQ